MDTKSKVLLWVLCILLVLSVSATFYKTVILEDFEYYESEEEETNEIDEEEDMTETDTVSEIDEEAGNGADTSQLNTSEEVDDTTE